ncbi:MAG: nucleoside-diphosphate kinase [Candidatus Micrarchaeota archaeon]|nr:nucleoside-diphosphate kinase [Candidatus Micrarchaeota archaeon]
MEQTLVLLKPDALQRSLIGRIIQRIEQKGLKIVGLKMLSLSKEICKEHYSHLLSKPFYPSLEKFMTSGPIIAMVVEGPAAVEIMRQLCGPTDGKKAPAGTIRGDFSISTQFNVIHASDSLQTAKIEIKRFFKPEEIFEWKKTLEDFTFSTEEA